MIKKYKLNKKSDKKMKFSSIKNVNACCKKR